MTSGRIGGSGCDSVRRLLPVLLFSMSFEKASEVQILVWVHVLVRAKVLVQNQVDFGLGPGPGLAAIPNPDLGPGLQWDTGRTELKEDSD